jgi:hypothetical protein
VSTIFSSSRLLPRHLYLLLLFGILVRVVFIAVHQRPLCSDEKEYDQLAHHIATTAAYTYESAPTAYRPVGYPAIIGLVYFVAGHNIIVVKILQAACDASISIFLILLLGDAPPRTRMFGAILWAVFLPAIFYSSLLLSETVFTFGFVICIWLLARYDLTNRRTLILLGGVLGLLTLIKPTIIVFGLILLFMLPQFNLRLKQLLPTALTFILVLAPWFARNYFTFGEMALTSNGGINLMIGNSPTSTGAYKYDFDPMLFHDSKGEFDVDHKALRLAVNYSWSNPGATIINAGKKLGRLFESEGSLLVLTFHDDPANQSTHYLQKYASLPVFWIVVTNFSYFFIALAAIFGFLCAPRNKLWWSVLAAFFSWIIVHAVFFGGGRFHFPLMPFLTVYAAHFVAEPRNSLRSLSGFRILVGVLFAAILCSLWIIEAYMVFNG